MRPVGLAGVHLAAPGGAQTERGWYTCPDERCLRRAVKAALGRGGDRPKIDAIVQAVISDSLEMARLWRAQRVEGLRRRGLSPNEPLVLAWETIAGRLSPALPAAGNGCPMAPGR